MDLLVLTPGLTRHGDGPDRYATEIAGRLASAGRVRVLLPAGPEAPVQDGSGFEIRAVDGRRAGLAARAAAEVRRAVQRDGYTSALAVTWPGALAALLGAPRPAPFRVHLVVQGPELLDQPGAAGRTRDRIRESVLRRVDTVFAVSRFAAGLAAERGVPTSRIHVIEGGVDADAMRPVDGTPVRRRLRLGSRPLLLASGPLEAAQGIDRILRALPDILTVHPGAVLVVAGEGPAVAALDELARHLGVSDAVRFLGPVPDAEWAATLSAANVYLRTPPGHGATPSGFGLACLEAGACRVPVVASRTGGLPDAVQDGVTGLLVPPDDPEAIASAVLYLLNEPGVAEELGAAGRLHATASAGWDHVVARMRPLLDDRPAS